MSENYALEQLQQRREFSALADMMFSFGLRSVMISTGTGLLMIAALWSWADSIALVAWLVVLLLAAALRAALVARRNRLEPGADIPRSMVHAFQFSIAVTGLVWGLSPLLVLSGFELVQLAVVIVFLAGMTSGAVSVLSALPVSFALFALPALLPLLLILLFRADVISLVLALAVVFFLIMMLKVSHDLHRILRGKVRLTLQLRRERDLAFTTVQALAEGVIRVRPDGRISYINEAAATILDVEPEAVINSIDFRQMVPIMTQHSGEVWDLIEQQVVSDGLPLDIPEDLWFMRQRDGADAQDGRWLRMIARPLLDGRDVLTEVVVVLRDRTIERVLFDRLEYHARHDPLTGLSNRRVLDAALQRALDMARKRGEVSDMLLFLDLDGFKQVNDQSGHLVGDRMLVEVAREMKRELRAEDLLCRVGGDEFALLLRNATRADAVVVAEKLAERVDALTLEHEGARNHVGVSYGLAPIDGSQDPNQIIEKADQACYLSKKRKQRVGGDDGTNGQG